MTAGTLGTACRLAVSFRSRPAYLVLYVTRVCDLNCPFCFNKTARHEPSGELTTDQFRRLARSTPRLFELLLSGGEPFLRNDLPDILNDFLKYTRPAVIAIPTHGGHTGRIVQCLESVMPVAGNTRVHINLSIDQIEAAHDRLRGRDGLWKQIVETAEALRQLKPRFPGIWTGVNTVVGTHNEHDLPAIVHWVHEHIQPDMHDIGLERDTVIQGSPQAILTQYRWIQSVIDAEYGNAITGLESALQAASMDYLADSVQVGRPAKQCLGGRALITITADGRVYPCEPFWLTPERFPAFDEPCLGNLKHVDFRLDRIVSSTHARRVIHGIKKGKCSCFWECALFCHMLFSPNGWFRVARAWLRT